MIHTLSVPYWLFLLLLPPVVVEIALVRAGPLPDLVLVLGLVLGLPLALDLVLVLDLGLALVLGLPLALDLVLALFVPVVICDRWYIRPVGILNRHKNYLNFI
jgi:hypothetical protein